MNQAPVFLLTAASSIGGLETVAAALAHGLAQAGRRVTLVQLRTPGGARSEALDRINHPLVEHRSLEHSARDYRGIVKAVRSLLPSDRSAIVHSHGKRADFIGALVVLGTRHRQVATVHGFVANTFKQRIGRRMHELTLRRADRIVAVSKPLEQELSKIAGARKVRLIENASPGVRTLDRAAARARLSQSMNTVVVGWVGRISPEKGLDIFLQAAAAQVDQTSRIVVIGDGNDRPVREAQARELGLSERIRWLGPVPGAAELFSGLDLLVLSSRTEGTPMNVLEAIDAGVPVVATAVGGVPALLEDGAGWLVSSESPRDLAAAMDEVVGDLRAAKGRAELALARLRARQQSADWISSHISLYEELVRS